MSEQNEIEIELTEDADAARPASQDDRQAAATQVDPHRSAADQRAGGDEEQPQAGADPGSAEGFAEARGAAERDTSLSPGVQKRIDRLTWQKGEFERAARAAMQTAEAAQARLQQMEARVGNLEVAGVHHSAQSLERDVDRLRGELRTAIDNDDVDRQMALQEKIGERKTQLRTIQTQARQVRQAPGTARPRGRPTGPAARPDLAKQWAAKNADWFERPGHEVETAAVLYIDRQLTTEGFDVNSPVYYEELDRRLAQQATGPVGGRSNGGGRFGSPVAGRTSNGEGARQRPGQVKLSAEQIRIAKDLGLYGNTKAMQAYAREIREQQRKI